MKRLVFIMCLWTVLIACRKDRRGSGDVCINASSTTVEVDESVQISNCGDDLPTDRIDLSIDWGDGHTSSGQAGSHAYDSPGDYTVRLMFNGEYSADIADVEDENKVKVEIHVEDN